MTVIKIRIGEEKGFGRFTGCAGCGMFPFLQGRKPVMKMLVCFAAAVFVCFGASTAVGQGSSRSNATKKISPIGADQASIFDNGDEFYNLRIRDKLEVGTRMGHAILLNDKRGSPNNDSFFGTVTMLREHQHYEPTLLYIQYKLDPVYGVGMSYDKFGAETWDEGGTDGIFWLSGPLLYAFGRYANETEFTPFCELGLGFYSSSFDADPGWLASNSGKSVNLGSAVGWYLGAGCDWHLDPNFSVNIYSRYARISDVKGEWFSGYQRMGDVVLTPSYLVIGIGAKYSF